MTRPTIVFLTTTFDMGGAERILIQLASGLSKAGYRVIGACLQRRSGQVGVELEQLGIEVFDVGMSSKIDIGGVSRLVRFLHENQVGVVYTFLIHAHLVGRLAARLARVPVLVSSQQAMLIESQALKLGNRLTARWCDAVVAVSRNVEEYLVHDVGIPRSKVTTIYNAIDCGRFDTVERRRERGEAGPVIGYCARLRREKDHRGLLRALKRVRLQFAGARLLLAGDGPERRALEEFVESEQLTDAVEFLGHVYDVRQFYSRLDLYVQASYIEGLPLAILEALACSLPVVATRVAGNEEILGNREAGVLVEPHDDQALAQAIIWMSSHADEARAMGTRGQRIVRERFGARTMVAATEHLVDQLVVNANGKTRTSTRQ